MDSNHVPAEVNGHLEDHGAPPRPALMYARAPEVRHVENEDPDVLLTPRFILRALWQWWYILAPISMLLAAVSSTAVFLTFTPVYRASADLQIARQAPYIAYEKREPLERSEEFVETQIELLQSELVLEPVVARKDIATLPEIRNRDNPADWLSRQINVNQVGHSELYRVSFDGPDPVHAALLVNAVMDGYFKVRDEDDDSKAERVLELLDEQKRSRGEAVLGLQGKMGSLRDEILSQNPLADLSKGDGERRSHPLDNLQELLVDAEVKRRVLEVEIQATQEAIAKDKIVVPDVELELALSESAEIQGLRKMINDKKAMLHRMEPLLAQGKEDPSYKRIERELQSYERSMENALNVVRPQIADQLSTVAAMDRKDALVKMEVELKRTQLREAMLRDKHNQQREEIRKSDDKLLELQFTETELAREEKVFDLIAERAAMVKTEMQAPGRVTLLRPATPPRTPVERIPLKSLALAILASGGLPFGLVLLWELSVRRISDVDQLTRHSEFAVVGEIAKLPLRTRFIGLGRARSLSLFEESIDSLRVCLWLPEERKDVRILAVCSSIHGEGKTSVASQLAVSIARSTGELTLLIDADMRSPDIHQIFNVPNEPGLTKLLDGRCAVQDAIVTAWSDQVHLLPAGKLHKSPHKLLGSPAMQTLLNELRDKYRYIVIDTPPILSAAEALQLAKLADGTIVCTMRNYSRERQVRLAYQRLVSAGARPLGAVFNAVPTRRYAYTYGSYDYARSFD